MGGASQQEGVWFAGLTQQPSLPSYNPSRRTAKLRRPLSYLYSTWPQESLSPPDTNLEGMGWRNPNTLRANPGLPVLRPLNASATLTQRARLPLGRNTGSSQTGLPWAGGLHGPPINTQMLTPKCTKTRNTSNTDTEVLTYRHTQTHTSELPRDTQRHSFLAGLLMPHKCTQTGTP